MTELDDLGQKYSVQPGIRVKYFIIGDADEEKRFETTKKEVISSTIKRIQGENSLRNIIEQLKNVSPILVTGSSGYLGSAIAQTLKVHGIQYVGIDLVGASTTDFIGCVSDIEFVRKASSKGCKSIIHTAALHAPNLDFYSNTDYHKVNVEGTRNILSIASEFQMEAIVFSSTTSLMITEEVKKQEKEGTAGPVILNHSVDYGTPRNIYGVTKKAAEKLCIEDRENNIAILRCSRFFVEDVFDTGAKASTRIVQKTNGNIKANEMLCGTRATLEDMIISHLVALDRLSKNKTNLKRNTIIGPLIISSISPLLTKSLENFIAPYSNFYESLGWSLPDHISRIYDSTNSWKALNYTPKWDFIRLFNDFNHDPISKVVIKDGHY